MDELHKRENSLAMRCEKLRRDQKRIIDWQDRTWISEMVSRHNLRPYWTDVEGGDQALRIEEFERGIFPTWKQIEDTGVARGDADYTIMHAQDIAIFESGWKVHRVGSNNKRSLKQKMAAQYADVMGE